MDIVVGALRTPTGEAAIRRAAEEARSRDATLHVVAFVRLPRDGEAAAGYLGDVASAEREVEAWFPEVVGSEIATAVHVPAGFSRPSDAILNVAERVPADLIVIGMRSRSRVGKAVLGSNAQDILLRAKCDVLSVPSPPGENW